MTMEWDKKLSQNPIKKEINEFFAKETGKRKDLGKVLFLETKVLMTTRNLKRNRIKSKNMIVPSPLEADYKVIKKYVGDCQNILLDELLSNKRTRPPQIASAWFDYMSSFNGAEGGDIKPKKDIDTYFKYKFPVHNSIFGVTYSFRQNKKADYTRQFIEEPEEEIQIIAAENGYGLIRLGRNWTYNGMNTQFWRVLELGKNFNLSI